MINVKMTACALLLGLSASAQAFPVPQPLEVTQTCSIRTKLSTNTGLQQQSTFLGSSGTGATAKQAQINSKNNTVKLLSSNPQTYIDRAAKRLPKGVTAVLTAVVVAGSSGGPGCDGAQIFEWKVTGTSMVY